MLLLVLVILILRSASFTKTAVFMVTFAGTVTLPVALDAVGPFMDTPMSANSLLRLSSFLTVSIYISLAVMSVLNVRTDAMYANISKSI